MEHQRQEGIEPVRLPDFKTKWKVLRGVKLRWFLLKLTSGIQGFCGWKITQQPKKKLLDFWFLNVKQFKRKELD